MKNLFARFANDESGATAIEYGLIGVAIIAAVTLTGTNLTGLFNRIAATLTAPAS